MMSQWPRGSKFVIRADEERMAVASEAAPMALSEDRGDFDRHTWKRTVARHTGFRLPAFTASCTGTDDGVQGHVVGPRRSGAEPRQSGRALCW
jgi:hypothetical protein